MRSKGKITTWNDDKGFGFVTPFAGGSQVFVHIKAFSNRSRRPTINDVVTFAMSKDGRGRPCAANATLAGDRLQPKIASEPSRTSIAVAIVFLGTVGGLSVTGQIPLVIGTAYAAMSLIAFGAYALDKSAAKRGSWRTAESSLHLLALAGGWPGALIAQQILRHKSRKSSFRVIFWVTVAINGALLLWLQSAEGERITQAASYWVAPLEALRYE